MRRSILLLGCLLFATLSLASGRVPKSLRYAHSDALAWVSESEAFDRDGRLRGELFGPLAGSLLVNLAANRDGMCHQALTQGPPERPPQTSFRELATEARAIIFGKVVGTQRGFYDALPGTLLEVAVTREIRPRQTNEPINEFVYIFIPSATFKTPDGTLCSRLLGMPNIPQMADTLIAFSHDRPTDQQGLIQPLDPTRELVFERNGKRVFTPADLKAEIGELRVDEIASRINGYTRELRRKQ